MLEIIYNRRGSNAMTLARQCSVTISLTKLFVEASSCSTFKQQIYPSSTNAKNSLRDKRGAAKLVWSCDSCQRGNRNVQSEDDGVKKAGVLSEQPRDRAATRLHALISEHVFL